MHRKRHLDIEQIPTNSMISSMTTPLHDYKTNIVYSRCYYKHLMFVINLASMPFLDGYSLK